MLNNKITCLNKHVLAMILTASIIQPGFAYKLEDTSLAKTKLKPTNQFSIKYDGKVAVSKTKFVINAPREKVWQVLTDFSSYPQIFSRIESCRVVKREGDLIWTESNLKPHIFISSKCQQAVNDLSGKPNVLDWKLIDGNFKSVKGKWELSTTPTTRKCAIVYTLTVDPGPIVPKFLVSFVLHNLQKEIVLALQEWIETTKVSARAQS